MEVLRAIIGDRKAGVSETKEAPQGAIVQNPCSSGTGETPASRAQHVPSGTDNPVNLEVLTEKVGTLDLRGEKNNRTRAAKKRAKKARLAETSDVDSTGDHSPLQGG
jgi:hypothetical protein